mmetsp:Transcript_11145/g.26192  ORF Transcript_11145/g.26192 Transcript_11145/m.26192 type:complete len:319 (-) Transcript_11145:147-1103(-)
MGATGAGNGGGTIDVEDADGGRAAPTRPASGAGSAIGNAAPGTGTGAGAIEVEGAGTATSIAVGTEGPTPIPGIVEPPVTSKWPGAVAAAASAMLGRVADPPTGMVLAGMKATTGTSAEDRGLWLPSEAVVLQEPGARLCPCGGCVGLLRFCVRLPLRPRGPLPRTVWGDKSVSWSLSLGLGKASSPLRGSVACSACQILGSKTAAGANASQVLGPVVPRPCEQGDGGGVDVSHSKGCSFACSPSTCNGSPAAFGSARRHSPLRLVVVGHNGVNASSSSDSSSSVASKLGISGLRCSRSWGRNRWLPPVGSDIVRWRS